MNWIKKILSIIQSDEDESVQEQKPVHPQQRLQQKELTTRMTYQYPKGEFRFPLIPDESSVKRTQPERKSQQHQKQEAVKPEHERPRKVEKSPNAGPFQPTDVPSPIYGFRERPKKKPVTIHSEEIEYEISSFSRHKDRPVSEDKQHNVIHLNEQKKERSLHTLVKQESDVKDNDENQAVTSMEVEEVASTQETAAETNRPDIVLQHTQTGAVMVERKSKAAESTDTTEISEIADTTEEAETTETAKTAEVPDVSVETTENNPVAVQETESENKLETVNNETQNDLSHSDREAKNEPQPVTSTESATAQNDAKAERPRRRSVPFNVMMLNQDRRKQAQKPAEPVSQPVAEKRTPEPQEEAQPVSKPVSQQSDEQDQDLPYYAFPSQDLLLPPVFKERDEEWLNAQAELLDETLFHFNVNAKVKNVTQGPSVTRFELFPEKGVKVSKITSLTDDIKLGLAARDIRMEAPIPGKMAVGIEIPNPTSRPVALREILADPAFTQSDATLPVALGLDIEGQPVVTDIGKMPHGLIAGATGSGKSVCINSILVSLLYHSSPDDLKMLLIDPKMVELAPYNHIPHLVSPVITDVKAATAALKWAVEEMERRYQLFAHSGVRDIKRYNQKVKEAGHYSQKLPYLVIVIDELADLMMMSPADVEEAICRIAQKARACGIHLLIATQRPSVDVITGLIKANVPTRIAFSVSSQVDSRTIIDSSGAERLLGRGDMLFLENGASKPVRLQGTFVSDDEIDQVVAHVRNERKVSYLFEQEELLAKVDIQDEEDELLLEACEFVMSHGGASTSLLQRHFRIGYNRAARLIDQMEKHGWISEAKGSRPRDVMMTGEDLEQLQETGTGKQL
ncbi:DNA translocase FtsK [Jeotgalibacillus sp. R-1-5s-1]|uniref:DNA translocase FtsK n=1 Tax=Jeotgalibacillus sp. R-1-5s-1 TaxID=2555897 RepID=UPI00106C7907|nr:DNA translocase FtsK [Jeotgalibacillus sp. R-1-5s-1]TFD98189.1 DNA translocase FtsK [Jeotgalibacillus sp. R-1-5s-1]